MLAPDSPTRALVTQLAEFYRAGNPRIHFGALASDWPHDSVTVGDLIESADTELAQPTKSESALRLIAGVAALDLSDPELLTITKFRLCENALAEIQSIVRKTMAGQPLPESSNEAASLMEEILHCVEYYNEREGCPDNLAKVRAFIKKGGN